MNENDVIVQDAPQECASCKEYETAIGVMIIVVFLTPIISMLIGLFAGKRLFKKD